MFNKFGEILKILLMQKCQSNTRAKHELCSLIYQPIFTEKSIKHQSILNMVSEHKFNMISEHL